jgi:hypothetical protein
LLLAPSAETVKFASSACKNGNIQLFSGVVQEKNGQNRSKSKSVKIDFQAKMVQSK